MHCDKLGLIQGVERKFGIRRSNFLNHLWVWDPSEEYEASRVNYLSGHALSG